MSCYRHFPPLFKTLRSFCQMHPGCYQTGSRILMPLLTKKHSRLFIRTSVAFKSLWGPKTCLKSWVHSFVSSLPDLSPWNSRAEDQGVRLVCSNPEIQSSLGIHGRLVPGPHTDTKIHGCSIPLYKMP